MDSMVLCYSLLNMKVIWLYMVSVPHPITMEDGGRGWEGGGKGRDERLNMKIYQNFVLTKFFLHLWQDKPLWVELKIGRNIYYYITTLSLFHFFRNNQHSEKWSVSFRNFFGKCKCISCYLLISSNLQYTLL